jgi:hypothetical protein
VENPEDIGPALARAGAAAAAGTPALVNVLTDWRAKAQTAKFATYAT